MNKLDPAHIIASGVALLMLAAIEGLAAAWYLPLDEHFWPLCAVGYAVLAPFAIWTWGNARGGEASELPVTWRDWIALFFLGLVLSVVLVAIDKTVEHPGFSLAFTWAAMAMTLIALPSAVRAALLDTLCRQ